MNGSPGPRATLVLLAALILAACERAPDAGGAAERTETSSVISEAQAIEIGERAAVALSTGLMGRVATAIQEGGPAYAVAFCSETALPLTDEIADGLDEGVEIKRTSSRLRNPRNAPDALERQALDHFEAELAAGRELPPYLLQHEGGEYRYYKPIVVAEFCTTCHAPRDELDPAVRRELEARYPDDQAVGYRIGDFRGLIRVSIPERARAR